MKSLLTLLALVVLSINSPIANAKSKSASTAKSASVQVQTININSADASQLAAVLKGVGLKKGQAIVEYRNKFGAFKSVDELTAVKGIGEKTVAKNRAKISL